MAPYKRSFFDRPPSKPLSPNEWSNINRVAATIGAFIYGSEQKPKQYVVMPHKQECIALFETEEDQKLAAKIANHLYFNGQYDLLREKGYHPPLIIFKFWKFCEEHKLEPSLTGQNVVLFPGLSLSYVNVSFANFSGSSWKIVKSRAKKNTVGFIAQSSQPSIIQMLQKRTNGQRQGSLRIEDFFSPAPKSTQGRKRKQKAPRVETLGNSTLFRYGFSIGKTRTSSDDSKLCIPSSVEESEESENRENEQPNTTNIPSTPPDESKRTKRRCPYNGPEKEIILDSQESPTEQLPSYSI